MTPRHSEIILLHSQTYFSTEVTQFELLVGEPCAETAL